MKSVFRQASNEIKCRKSKKISLAECVLSQKETKYCRKSRTISQNQWHLQTGQPVCVIIELRVNCSICPTLLWTSHMNPIRCKLFKVSIHRSGCVFVALSLVFRRQFFFLIHYTKWLSPIFVLRQTNYKMMVAMQQAIPYGDGDLMSLVSCSTFNLSYIHTWVSNVVDGEPLG